VSVRAYVRTVALRRPDHVRDLRVEVGVHEPDAAAVLALQPGHRLPQQLVVVAGEVVVAPEAAGLVVVAVLARARVQRQVQREAPDRQHPGHHHVHSAQPDQRLQSVRARAFRLAGRSGGGNDDESRRHVVYLCVTFAGDNVKYLPPRRLRSGPRSRAHSS
jgi:hypothetical protein